MNPLSYCLDYQTMKVLSRAMGNCLPTSQGLPDLPNGGYSLISLPKEDKK